MDAHGIEPAETVPASRKLGRDEARALVHEVERVVVAKGRSVRELPGGMDASDEVVDALLGPTGKLRAPTLRIGRTVLVGFDHERYRQVLG